MIEVQTSKQIELNFSHRKVWYSKYGYLVTGHFWRKFFPDGTFSGNSESNGTNGQFASYSRAESIDGTTVARSKLLELLTMGMANLDTKFYCKLSTQNEGQQKISF
jgi:hypothetical protein